MCSHSILSNYAKRKEKTPNCIFLTCLSLCFISPMFYCKYCHKGMKDIIIKIAREKCVCACLRACVGRGGFTHIEIKATTLYLNLVQMMKVWCSLILIWKWKSQKTHMKAYFNRMTNIQSSHSALGIQKNRSALKINLIVINHLGQCLELL
jgi:hypothetical protein